MRKLIALAVIAGVLLVGAFFVGYVVGTTVSPLQQPAAIVLGVTDGA